jgi:hypothetical protein
MNTEMKAHDYLQIAILCIIWANVTKYEGSATMSYALSVVASVLCVARVFCRPGKGK